MLIRCTALLWPTHHHLQAAPTLHSTSRLSQVVNTAAGRQHQLWMATSMPTPTSPHTASGPAPARPTAGGVLTCKQSTRSQISRSCVQTTRERTTWQPRISSSAWGCTPSLETLPVGNPAGMRCASDQPSRCGACCLHPSRAQRPPGAAL